jgi:hypothetical protein
MTDRYEELYARLVARPQTTVERVREQLALNERESAASDLPAREDVPASSPAIGTGLPPSIETGRNGVKILARPPIARPPWRDGLGRDGLGRDGLTRDGLARDVARPPRSAERARDARDSREARERLRDRSRDASGPADRSGDTGGRG